MTPFALALSAIVAPTFLRVLPGGAEVAIATDSELVQRATEGDRHACDALVARHIAAVLRRAQRLLGPTADAEDVVQDAFYEALRDLSRLEDKSRFGAWVQKIAIHHVHRRDWLGCYATSRDSCSMKWLSSSTSRWPPPSAALPESRAK